LSDGLKVVKSWIPDDCEQTMTKYAVITVAAIFIAGCNSSPQPLSAENMVGGASVAGFTQVPMAQATTSLTLDWGKKGKAGQVAIADVLSFNGSKPKISAPDGWHFIRDDFSASTRQSLYWHAIQANDPSAAMWTFDAPVDTKGAIVLLDNAALDSPVDMSSGKTDTSGTLNAKSVVTTEDGDLILLFYATDFHIPGLAPKLPPDTRTVTDQEDVSHEYWILTTYQSENGATDDIPVGEGQLFSWTAAQVAIKHRAATPSPN
jgi:hypothetical protein